MTYTLIIIGIFSMVAGALYKLATKSAKRDIVRFAIVAILSMFLIGFLNNAKADTLVSYLGAEYGVDLSHDLSGSHPQCQPGERDDIASDGRLYLGLKLAESPFYLEIDGWRHKSCALTADRNVFNGYGFKIGGTFEFNLWDFGD
jgi:hypothetical protein